MVPADEAELARLRERLHADGRPTYDEGVARLAEILQRGEQ